MNAARSLAIAICALAGTAHAQPSMALVRAALTASSTVEMCAGVSPQRAATYRELHKAWRASQETAVLERDKDYAEAEAEIVDDMKKNVAKMTEVERTKAAGICETQLMPALRRGAGLPN